MNKLRNGLVGTLASLVLAGCIDSKKLDTQPTEDSYNISLEVVVEQPESIIKPTIPNLKPVEEVIPEPLPEYTRDEIVPTGEEFKNRYSGGIFGIFESSEDNSYKNRMNFREKIDRIDKHPKEALSAFSHSDMEEFETYFSGELLGSGNVLFLNETFPDFYWMRVFKSKMGVYSDIDLGDITESDKIKIFLDEKLRGYPYTSFEPEKSESNSDLYFGDMYVKINGKDTRGKNVNFPFWVGNFEFSIYQSRLEKQGYRIEEDLTDEQAVEELKKYALNDWISWRVDTRFLKNEEEKELFYSKDGPLYNAVQETVEELIETSDYQPYLQKIAKRRFEEEPTFVGMLEDVYFGAIEKVIIGPGIAGAKAAGEAARNPVRTRIKMRR